MVKKAHLKDGVAVHEPTGVEVVPGASKLPPSQSYAFTGTGGESLGSIRAPTRSTLRWTRGQAGSRIEISSSGAHPIAIASTGGHGTAPIGAGTYGDVTVRATGRWTIVIVPTH